MQIQEMIKVNGKLYPHTRNMTPEEEAQVNNPTAEEQIETLKQQLANSDYKAIKYAEGWLSEEEYEPIKAERQRIRDEINRLQAEV